MMSTAERARLRAAWIKRVRDMDPEHVLVLVEALRLCAASDRSDTELALDLIGSDIRACIKALDAVSATARGLDDLVAEDVHRAARTVVTLRDAILRVRPQAAT